VKPPTKGRHQDSLPGIKDRYEKFHAVGYTDSHEVARLLPAAKLPDRYLPDKAAI
jgi:ATP-dependent Clp protease ATP-binding subunit ClpC